jgi:hypothetical protein
MKLRITMIAAAMVLLTGCATNKDYQLYAETQQKIAQAQAMVETARYAALAEIAKTGDPGARVAAVMSINFGSQGSNSPRVNQVAAPKSFGETALQWTSVLLPSLTNIYGVTANRQIAVTQSNNAAAVAKSTNDTFASMNTTGHAANINIAEQGFTVVNASSNTAITSVANAANTSIQAVADVIPQLQPNVTTTSTTNNNTVAP